MATRKPANEGPLETDVQGQLAQIAHTNRIALRVVAPIAGLILLPLAASLWMRVETLREEQDWKLVARLQTSIDTLVGLQDWDKVTELEEVIDTLDSRVDALESERTRLFKTGEDGALTFTAESIRATNIRAESAHIVSSDGSTLMWLGPTDAGDTAIKIHAPSGQMRASLVASDMDAQLTLYDSRGRNRLAMGTSDDPSSTDLVGTVTGIDIFDPDRETAIQMSLDGARALFLVGDSKRSLSGIVSDTKLWMDIKDQAGLGAQQIHGAISDGRPTLEITADGDPLVELALLAGAFVRQEQKIQELTARVQELEDD